MATLPTRQTKTVNLVTIEGGEVEVYTSLTAGDVQEINQNPNSDIITPLRLLIKSWNLTNEEGKPLKVNDEHVRLLDIRDVNKLIEEAGVSMTDFLGETSQNSNG